MPRKGGVPENLKKGKKFQKGQSGNPAGGSRASSLTAILSHMADLKITIPKHPITKQLNVKMTVREAIALKVLSRALLGDHKAYEAFHDRTEGKTKDEIKHEVVLNDDQLSKTRESISSIITKFAAGRASSDT